MTKWLVVRFDGLVCSLPTNREAARELMLWLCANTRRPYRLVQVEVEHEGDGRVA